LHDTSPVRQSDSQTGMDTREGANPKAYPHIRK
jgi:hypothetical protein